MPTVLQQDGFSVMIYTRDHLPRHVHVFRAESEVVVNIDTLEVRDIFGMRVKDLRTAMEIVAQHQAFLQNEWIRIKPIV